MLWINLKLNVMAHMEFEHEYYDITDLHVNL